ncbi:GumC family protein [Opitutus terrae]|uniref:Capsular exopolysaccharide family n=1 Tax=Opitutus terrae (strain DSM 11246 / JCM 15787 / PB90-1) TaxID=452637 RepID=B1ZMW1_OPITP|nr:polysaccharide biosynthesis tyrosine autokinase [Opitutus terrae]ACB75389.1 capsular exopolysaccharide family [Opitutus terrae PB90-1]
MVPTSASKDSASLADFMQLLRQRKALIALILGLVLITTIVVTAFLPRWYLATTKIRVEKPEGEVKLFQAQSSSYYDPYFLQDQFKIMQSEKILYPVIENLGLNTRLAPLLGATGPLPSAMTYRYLLNKMLAVESQRSSSLIEINVYAQEPPLAAAIANEIARVYSDDRIALATSEQREGLAHLRKELEAQEQVVSAQRDTVERLRKDLNISGVDLNARYSDMEIETLRQMQNSLIALSVDAIGRRTRWERFKSIAPADRLSLVNSELIQDTNIQNLLQAYLVADQNVTRLQSRLGEAHPDLIAAVDNRAKIREQLDGQLRGYESALEIAYQEADSRVAELKNQLAQAKVAQILSARERMRPFEEAAQKLEDETRLLTTLKLTLRQREIDFQVPKRTIEILNTAEPPRYPSRPNWTLSIALALVFGSLLGVGAALLLEYFDTSFRTVGDVETRLKLPVLGVIPRQTDPLGGDEDPAEAEPYRVLQTNLNLALKPGQPASLVIFSAGPGEGKSTTLFRLARLAAAAGERVVLIDSDFRRPAQHRLAERPREPGLSDWLMNRQPLETIVQRELAPNLDFIPSGGVPGFTLGLLQVNRLKELIATLRGRYDKILFDSPPIIGVSDASVLASVMDGAVLLIQHRRNPQSMVLRAQQIVEAIKTPLLGVVLTQVPENAGGDYGYYTHNYSYYSDGSHRRHRPGPSAAHQAAPAVEGDRLVLREPERKDPA